MARAAAGQRVGSLKASSDGLVTFEAQDGFTVVRLVGSRALGVLDAERLADHYQDAVKRSGARLVLDFSGRKELGLGVIRAAADACRRCRDLGGRGAVSGLPKGAGSVLRALPDGDAAVICRDVRAARRRMADGKPFKFPWAA
ncbi:MAG: hypothetical protein AAGG07_06910 [Planctomycetota bacterium]